jgi:hypothetical protein
MSTSAVVWLREDLRLGCGRAGHTSIESDQIRRTGEDVCEETERAGGLSAKVRTEACEAAAGEVTIAAISGTNVPVRFGARCGASMRNGVGASGVAQTSEAALTLLGAASRSCSQRPSAAVCIAIAAHDPTHASAAGAPVSMNAIANAMVRNTSLLEET